MQGSRGRAARGCAGGAVEVGVCVWSPGYRGLAAARVREGACGGEGVEISDQVVDEFFWGCEMNVGACDGVGGEVVKLGVYRVCYGVKEARGGPLEVYRVE